MCYALRVNMAQTRTTNANPSPQAGQRMLYFLSEAAKTARGEDSKELVAGLAGVGVRTVDRFEKGKGWPEKLDEILEAYAIVSGLGDVRQLWQHALDLWHAHGRAPLISRREDAADPETTQRRFVDQLRAARRVRREAPPEPAETTTATRKKRAAGQ